MMNYLQILTTIAVQADEITGDAIQVFVNFFIAIGMFVVLFLPLLLIPYIFIKLGSTAGKVQAKMNSMGRKGVRSGTKRGKQAYNDSGFGQARQLRRDARKSERRKRTLEGKGLGGKLFQAEGAINSRIPRTAGQRAGDIAMTESIQAQQQKLEDARTATLKQAVTKRAGLNYAPLIGQMQAGENAAAFAARYHSETGESLDAGQINDLEGLRAEFGNQVGTTEFSRAALLASHDLGSEVKHIDHATKSYANKMQAEGKNDLEINNELSGVMDASAKSGGVYAMSGAGWDPSKGGYGRFNTKDADRIISSADFGSFDSGQFGDLKKARNTSGHLDLGLMGGDEHALAVAVINQLSSSDQAARTAMLKRIAEARGKKSFNDLTALVEATGQSKELNDIIAGFK